ncbi:TPA: acyltransferase [Yersinia enterocolitica]|nr:acyltransferase [Yersinia enterocolitica]
MKYRDDLDGLRAVAVIAVFFYHCHLTISGINFLKGGFFGVDIFFVLSGYLISNIIRESLNKGKVDFLNFYIKRFKRIYPALLVISLLTSIVAYQLLLPDELFSYGKSLLSSLLFLSNYYFYSVDPYTATSSLYNFLLHTWSLSAEWQFYMFFPIFMVIISRFFKSHIFQILLVAALLSFTAAQILTVKNADLSFYSFLTRAWELMAGALLSFISRDFLVQEQKKNSIILKLMPIVGIYLIFFSLVFIDDSMPHPSFITLVPVLGTSLLIIFSNQSEIVGKILSLKPIVFIGAISYSLYLWHQPVLVVFRIVKHENINFLQSILLLIITFSLSIVTYFFIEKPFRRNLNKWKIVAIVVTIVAAFSFAIITIYTKGLPERFEKHDIAKLILNLNGNKLHEVNGIKCHDNNIENSCGISNDKKSLSNVILVGDSHAGSLGYSLENIAGNNFNLIQLTSDVCLGMDNIDMYDRGIIHKICQDRSSQFSKYIESKNDVIIFSARLNWYLSGNQYVNEYGDVEGSLDNKQVPKNGNPLYDEILSKLNLWAKNHTLILIYPEPELGIDIPKLISHRLQSLFSIDEKIKFIENYNFSISKSKYLERSSVSYALLDSVVGPNIIRVYPEKLLCDDEKCYPYSKDKSRLYYFDDDHLSIYGAELLINSFKQPLFEVLKQSQN